MEKEQMLRDPDVFPSDEEIEKAVKGSYGAYREFVGSLPGMNVSIEWRYYNDGKAWLAKGTNKKKTVFWMSAWDGYFRISLFFMDKTRGGVQDLPIADGLKKRIASEKPMGKLIPLIMDVTDKSQLADAKLLIGYKRDLK